MQILSKRKRLSTTPNDMKVPNKRPRTNPEPGIILVPHLSRLYAIQIDLQRSLCVGLVHCSVSPARNTGIIQNVLNHISLQTVSGPASSCTLEDLRRLVWLWEWDSSTLAAGTPSQDDSDSSTRTCRGAMGFVLTLATHYSSLDRKRVPAYGIGIQVQVEEDTGSQKDGGMVAVARWISASDRRNIEFYQKLVRWQIYNETRGDEGFEAMPPWATAWHRGLCVDDV
ncbi:hypothetical protein BDZ89DRAFT_1151573 [Hymenopellis radicata]|nr:hypothetical protein BDZ89DRAFT_1151573 [Hymenopellis radicata]